MAFEASKSPPAELEHRVVTVQASVVNTVEIPCDPRDPDFSRWFDTGEGTQPLRRSNHVTALVDGDEAFAAMADAIDTAGSATDYIYMTNWWVDLDFELRPAKPSKLGAASTKLGDLLTTAVANGVQVRALYWDQVGSQNAAEAKRVNKLDNPAVPGANGGAILDDNTLNNTEIDSTTGSPAHHFGSHHQKILIVKGTDGLTAFCGGIDFNTDRVFAVSRQPGSPMHDVHCQIEGPAAFDVLNIFIQRWTDHPDSPAIEKAKGALRGIGEPVPPNRGDQYVQIGRTYGNGAKHSGIKSVTGNSFYTFASSGEMTAKRIIFKAIEQASRFIYVEDQYLVSMEASNKLLAQLPKIQKLVVLIPHPSISDHPHIWKMTKRFIDNLKGDPKLVVCYRKPTEPRRIPRRSPPPRPAATFTQRCGLWTINLR